MKRYFAPLEGLTTHVLRRAHSQIFERAEKYFTPFLALTQNHVFSQKELLEIAPESNAGMVVVPQVLTNNAEDFLWAAREMKKRGYEEVNLNMGCPSGTVVTKGRGAGLLRDGEALRQLLDAIFAHTPVRVSVKTRLGLFEAEEFADILAVLKDYPFCEIIVHPRVRAQYYRGVPDEATFLAAYSAISTPLVYNGDLFDREQVAAFARRAPQVETVMLGRGALANPALFGECTGGAPLDACRLQAFHQCIWEGYSQAMGAGNAVRRMQELWTYMFCAFEGAKKQEKRLRKAKKPEEYRDAVAALFDSAQVSPIAGYHAEAYPRQDLK